MLQLCLYSQFRLFRQKKYPDAAYISLFHRSHFTTPWDVWVFTVCLFHGHFIAVKSWPAPYGHGLELKVVVTLGRALLDYPQIVYIENSISFFFRKNLWFSATSIIWFVMSEQPPKYCWECGIDLKTKPSSGLKFCPECGFKIQQRDDGLSVRFCSQCGCRLHTSNSAVKRKIEGTFVGLHFRSYD